MSFAQNGVQFVSQAVIQSQIMAKLETVLCEHAVTASAEVAIGIANKLQHAIGEACREID